jgi:hypothetical protein
MTDVQFYRQETGDRKTHHRTITAQLAKNPARRRRIVKLYAQGLSDRQVGERTGRSHGAARDMMRRTIWAVHKAIHGLPRYHKIGHPHVTRPRKAAPPPATAARIEAPAEPDTPRGFREFLTAAERALL